MRSYINTLRYRELTEFAKTNYVAHKQLFDKIKERVDARVRHKVDLEQATAIGIGRDILIDRSYEFG